MMSVCSIDGCGRPVKARGLCNSCYKRAIRSGTLGDYSICGDIPSLPGEEWRDVDGVYRVMVSNMGRLKSIRCGGRLLKLSVLPSSKGTHLGALVSIAQPRSTKRVVLAKAVLTAFHGPATGAYTRVHYIDGDYTNCRADNLRWSDDAGYFLPLAIDTVISSDHPDSIPLFCFLTGNKEALNPILRELSAMLPRFVARLARERSLPYDVDPEGCSQEALIDGIIKIRQGKGPQADKLKSWFVGVAKRRFLQKTSEPRELLMDREMDVDSTDSLGSCDVYATE